jgi:hypothetical protein
MSSQSHRLLTLFAFALILLIATWLRVHEAGTIAPGLHFDEATDLLRSWRIGSGYGVPLYFNESPEPFDGFYRGVFGYFVGHDRVIQRYALSYLSILSVAATMGAARALYAKHPHRDIIILIAGLVIAVMPASIMLGRTIYRANWVAPLCMLGLMWLARAWNTHKTRHYLFAAVFAALGASVYPAGLFLPPTLVLIGILAALADRRTFPGWWRLAMMALVFLVLMIPWIYLYIRIPDWLTQRLDDLSGTGLPIIGNPAAFLEQLGLSLRLIFLPPVLREPFYNAIVYNAATTALLNPVFVVLFVAGVLWTLRHWREPRAFAPLIMTVGMLMPGALTISPEETIRINGMFGALALVVGAGAGTIANTKRTAKSPRTPSEDKREEIKHGELTSVDRRIIFPLSSAKRVGEGLGVRGALVALLIIFTPIYTWTTIRAHYANWSYGDALFFTRLQAQADYIRASDVPIYLPLEYMNYRLTVAYLRTAAFPHLRAYAGEALPAGELFLPFDASYGTPLISRPNTAYVLLLPETGETVILPPLPQPELQALENQAREEGTALTDSQGRELGHTLAIDAENNPFAEVLYEDFTDAEPIAVFDDNLEVLAVRAPTSLTPNEFVPVTVYWRLRRQPAADYFMMLQIWNGQQQSYGRHEDWYNDIFYDFAPTPMWNVGEVYAQTRWVQAFPEIPDGGYRFALRVFTYPSARSSHFTASFGFPGRGDWLLTARAFVGAPPNAELSGEVLTVDARLGDGIRLIAASFEPPLEDLQVGDTLTVTLEWEALTPPPDDYILFLHLLGAEGQMVTQQDARPSDMYPTDTWYAGLRITTTHTLTLPDDARGEYQLALGMYNYPAQERLTITQNGAPLNNGVLVLP